MLKNENPTAIKMLTRLSDLLRITLKKTDQQVSSLREELDALELYLGIRCQAFSSSHSSKTPCSTGSIRWPPAVACGFQRNACRTNSC